METNYIESLVNLGLRPQEAQVYLACLKLGQATVSKIAEEAQVQRTFVYDILADLHKRGIASEVEIHGKKNYSVVSIEQFKELQLLKFKQFEALIPEFKAIQKKVGDRPRVKFYEGREGIMAALYDPLETLKAGETIRAFANAEGFYENEPEFVNEYIKERVKRGILSQTIVVDTEETRRYVAQDKAQLRKTIGVPADKFPFTNEIDIYANKVAIMSLKGEMLAVIIESESVANTQRAIFELSWIGAQHLQK